jgi:orotidine-5'-phosphate decarboxylase
MQPESPIILVLDYSSAEDASKLVEKVDPRLCALKVGNELYAAAGPDYVRRLVGQGFRVFLDLKFHDIPNTVAQACANATRLGVWMLNVHAWGGRAMMTAAREAVEHEAARMNSPRPLLIAVTVLTSLSAPELAEVGVPTAPDEQVLRLARLTQSCGLDGVVCSPLEAPLLRAELGRPFCLVTPGIRLPGGDAHDQTRIATPESAMRAGSDYLVIGRAITAARDPLATLREIALELQRIAKDTP